MAIASGKMSGAGGGGSITLHLQVDTKKLVKFLRKWPITLKQQDQAIYRAINDTTAKFKTAMKDDIARWTGIRLKKRIERGMRFDKAGPGKWSGALIVKDEYILITRRNFGASWTRSARKKGAGARHSAWNRPQEAKQTFMIAGKQVIFKHRAHPTKHRGDLVALSGPNPAREMVRHVGHVQMVLNAMATTTFLPRVVHHVQRSAAAAAG